MLPDGNQIRPLFVNPPERPQIIYWYQPFQFENLVRITAQRKFLSSPAANSKLAAIEVNGTALLQVSRSRS